MRRSAILLLALASASSFAQTYRWVDPATGRTVISDIPPPASAKGVSEVVSATAADDPQLSFAAKRAAGNFPVILYTTKDCANECRQARDLLQSRGTPFTEKVVQKPEEAEEVKKLVGGFFVPTLKVGREVQHGFQAGAYNKLLDLAGYPDKTGGKAAGGTEK